MSDEPRIEDLTDEEVEQVLDSAAAEKGRRDREKMLSELWVCTGCSMLLEYRELKEGRPCPTCGAEGSYVKTHRGKTG